MYHFFRLYGNTWFQGITTAVMPRAHFLLACGLLTLKLGAQTTGPFVNFEAQHTRPVCLSPRRHTAVRGQYAGCQTVGP